MWEPGPCDLGGRREHGGETRTDGVESPTCIIADRGPPGAEPRVTDPFAYTAPGRSEPQPPTQKTPWLNRVFTTFVNEEPHR